MSEVLPAWRARLDQMRRKDLMWNRLIGRQAVQQISKIYGLLEHANCPWWGASIVVPDEPPPVTKDLKDGWKIP